MVVVSVQGAIVSNRVQLDNRPPAGQQSRLGRNVHAKRAE